MPTQPTTEPALAPELEALAHAADQRLRAELDRNDAEVCERDQAVVHAASAAIAAGMSLGTVAQAEQIGYSRARRELGSELLRRVERTARRTREATAEYEQTVARAARLGLAHRDIARSTDRTRQHPLDHHPHQRHHDDRRQGAGVPRQRASARRTRRA
jgi:biotin synthase-related radical SAM superfamily protein